MEHEFHQIGEENVLKLEIIKRCLHLLTSCFVTNNVVTKMLYLK